ncbi:MAG: hypothetical protein AABO58_01040 [Acidobacteriota bacterium]
MIRAGGDELLSISFAAGDRTLHTEQRLRLLSWIVNAVTREERKRSLRADRAPCPDGETDASNPGAS